MSEYIYLKKKEALQFIDLFDVSTKRLTEPRISWFGQPTMSKEEAIDKIENGFIPESFVMCGRDKNNSLEVVYIYKERKNFSKKGYQITTNALGKIEDQYCKDIGGALQIAQEMLIKYIQKK